MDKKYTLYLCGYQSWHPVGAVPSDLLVVDFDGGNVLNYVWVDIFILV